MNSKTVIIWLPGLISFLLEKENNMEYPIRSDSSYEWYFAYNLLFHFLHLIIESW